MPETRGQFQRHQTHQNTRAYACDFHEGFLPHGKVLRIGNRKNSDISSSLSLSRVRHPRMRGWGCGAVRIEPSHPIPSTLTFRKAMASAPHSATTMASFPSRVSVSAITTKNLIDPMSKNLVISEESMGNSARRSPPSPPPPPRGGRDDEARSSLPRRAAIAVVLVIADEEASTLPGNGIISRSDEDLRRTAVVVVVVVVAPAADDATAAADDGRAAAITAAAAMTVARRGRRSIPRRGRGVDDGRLETMRIRRPSSPLDDDDDDDDDAMIMGGCCC